MVMAGGPDSSQEEVEAGMKSFSLDGLLGTAVEALRILIERDRAAGRAGREGVVA
jgi:hypothetical protein